MYVPIGGEGRLQGLNPTQVLSPRHGTPGEGLGRPYRSHKIPACDRCRKRKVRCELDTPGQACYLCRTSGAICIQTQKEERPISSVTSAVQRHENTDPLIENHGGHHSPKRRRLRHAQDELPRPGYAETMSFESHVSPHQPQMYTEDALPTRTQRPARPEAGGSKSTMIVGPAMAEDLQMIENYMVSQGPLHNSPRDPLYDTVSDNPQDPVLYVTVPRRRQGLSLNNRPGEKQREILEQILGPLIDEAIAVYFENIHPSFPILDEEHFKHLYKTDDRSLSAALVCEVLVSSLIYWHRSKSLRSHPCPDLRYAWNLAVAALQEEFLAPGMSTILAALIDLNGRPTTSITGNTINSGRTVALAHVLGLNRDPQTWKISNAEKNMRVRLWWGVLIHDRWSSFAHGVPAQVIKYQYEVPVPSVATLMTHGLETPARIEAAKCFVALCTLTEILGDILPLVYDRRQRSGTEVSKVLRRLETALDNWEDSEPAISVLRDRGGGLPVSGSSNLRLGFLSAKMLICRIAFRSATHSAEPGLVEVRQYSQAILRESARTILSFLCSLKSEHLSEFWSPYAAYHLASATIILLRCAIETSDPQTAENCKLSLTSFMDRLRRARAEDHWDLADICLAQCETPIKQIYGDQNTSPSQYAGPTPVPSTMDHRIASRVPARAVDMMGPEMFNLNNYSGGVHIGPSVTDTQNNVHGFEYPWADMWDLL